MRVNHFLFIALLMSVPVMADEQPDAELLEFLGGLEIEVNGEWVNPLSLDIEPNNADVAQDTTQTPGGKSHE